jgi:cobalamin biosynthesis Mg chelatase CobN
MNQGMDNMVDSNPEHGMLDEVFSPMRQAGGNFLDDIKNRGEALIASVRDSVEDQSERALQSVESVFPGSANKVQHSIPNRGPQAGQPVSSSNGIPFWGWVLIVIVILVIIWLFMHRKKSA